MEMEKILLSEDEIRKFFKVSRKTIWRWRRMRKPLPTIKIGGKLYFDFNEVRKWVDGHRL